MRILLAHNSTYYPAHGGGDVSNRLLLEALAARGHECTVVSRTAAHGPDAGRELLAELARRDVTATVEEPGIVRFRLNGVEIDTATEAPNLREYFTRRISAFQPEIVIASTDDSAQVLLDAALESAVPVVYLARATIALPFGPDCAFPSAAKTEAIRRASGVVGVSGYVAGYIRQWSGIEAVSLPISFMGAGPFPCLGNFENEFVTLVNPCVVKGIDIFTGLAEAMPKLRFAAVPTWGTGEGDLAKLRRQTNITVLDPVDNIDRILERTRIIAVPSVWAEARSRIVMESMLRGVPVIASNTGGLPEAKLGVPYVLPVTPIPGYQGKVDAQMVPVAETPLQDLAPWIEALTRLTGDRDHWTEIANRSREAATNYLKNDLRIEPFEGFLRERISRSALERSPSLASPDKRRLLALRLRQNLLAADLDPTRPNLLCFPWAGAGPTAYRTWREALNAIPVRYPGSAESVAGIVQSLVQHIGPKLKGSFAFFGHSMGAGIAFEFTRELRRRGLPLPFALFVSSATAPQLRTEIAPDPTGVGSSNALQDRVAADSRLYRRYLYQTEAPLEIPIRAYGGASDPNISIENLAAWQEQTTISFRLRLFDGGHLYLNESPGELLKALTEDIDELLPR